MQEKFWEKNLKAELNFEEDIDELENKYLVVIINNNKYALELDKVNEIVVLNETKIFPDMGEFDRGIIKLRNQVVRVVDLRKKFRFPTFEDQDYELIETLLATKQEHENWANNLVESIENNKEFKLTTNPHQCEFGKWYDNYKTNNLGLKNYLIEFDMPHKRLHNSARIALKAENKEKARKVIEEKTLPELEKLKALFEGIGEALKSSHREVAVIFNEKIDGKLFGVSADLVDSIVKIKDEDIDIPKVSRNDTILKGIGKVGDDVYNIIDPYRI